MSSLVIKFHFNDEVRRVSVPKASSQETTESTITYDQLKSLVSDLAIIPTDKRFSLQWNDEEGELITVGSDKEVKGAINVMTAGGGNTLRFIVREVAVLKLEMTTTSPGGSQTGTNIGMNLFPF